MKHRESEQTQLRVSRLLNRDSVMLHAEMPSVQTALETLVELQESNGVITNGTAYYKAVCERERAGGTTATKTEQAERLILDLLADGKELASEDIVKAAAEAGISERTVQNAKRNMGGILGARRVGGQWYNFIKKKQPPEPAS